MSRCLRTRNFKGLAAYGHRIVKVLTDIASYEICDYGQHPLLSVITYLNTTDSDSKAPSGITGAVRRCYIAFWTVK